MGFKTNDRVFKEIFDVFHIVYITIKFLDIVYTTWSRPFSVYSVARVKRTISWKKIKNKKEDVSALRGILGARRYFSCAARVPRSTPKNFFSLSFFSLCDRLRQKRVTSCSLGKLKTERRKKV